MTGLADEHRHKWTEHPPGTIGGQSVWACDCGLYSVGGDLAIYPVGEVMAAIHDHQVRATPTGNDGRSDG